MTDPSEIKVIRKRPEPKDLDSGRVREEGKELLQALIRGLVDHPDSIVVSYSFGDKTTVYKVECDQKCLGQIIGAKGKNINGVRAVISATLARKGVRAVVEIPYYCVDA
ncbi:KH domain-containing protein [Bdellovibrio bacteriovorus]|uniref:RNA-binding protein KhpA n=1 Tax=Bdellovibrio bacteriovorus TaxID=959 RepID=A0A150WD66_BDEBC|nr:KH domain-containing protein [Bdellovibrio bacteriovorus]KYG61005.1 KH domain-containing protein [Bdellovibrio bacteriovorus]